MVSKPAICRLIFLLNIGPGLVYSDNAKEFYCLSLAAVTLRHNDIYWFIASLDSAYFSFFN